MTDTEELLLDLSEVPNIDISPDKISSIGKRKFDNDRQGEHWTVTKKSNQKNTNNAGHSYEVIMKKLDPISTTGQNSFRS